MSTDDLVLNKASRTKKTEVASKDLFNIPSSHKKNSRGFVCFSVRMVKFLMSLNKS
jgi:hypothetical protein